MKNLLLAAIAAVATVMGSASALAQTPMTTSTRFPLGASTFVPCAGEQVETSGTAHEVIQLVPLGDGFTVRMLHSNYQGLSGMGLTSGDRYQAVSAATEITPIAKATVYTLVLTVQFLGQGPDNNFEEHFLFHFTVNANGEVTASLNELRVECR